jgi:uncharacterized Zn-finger protein
MDEVSKFLNMNTMQFSCSGIGKNSHGVVILDFKKSPEISCPECGTIYRHKTQQSNSEIHPALWPKLRKE